MSVRRGSHQRTGHLRRELFGSQLLNYTVKYIAGTLSVTDPLSAITEIKGASSHSETLTIGQTDTLTATGKFADASRALCQWLAEAALPVRLCPRPYPAQPWPKPEASYTPSAASMAQPS